MTKQTKHQKRTKELRTLLNEKIGNPELFTGRKKEMAYLLKISISAIDFHRRNLREKLNIKGKKVNLRSFLLAHLD